ncbi:MAG: hypothetical protein WBF06_04460 [Candidatus Acidiferrales bacterium]
MGLKEFLTRLGFTEHPFQFTNADEEEHLQSYFVPPPYFVSIWGDPKSPKSQVIFAPRGGGKTAQRRMIEYKSEKANVFVITYDRFEKLSEVELETLSVDYHLRNIIEKGLLGFLLELHARGLQGPSFSNAERDQIDHLCDHYLSRITRLEAIEALSSLKTLSAGAKQFLREWSGPLNSLFSAALAAKGVPFTKLSLGGAPVQHDSLGGSLKAHFELVRDLLLSVGFESIYVLVDKVDETAETGNNAGASFNLVKPLLRDLELLQIRKVAFTFFLWDLLLARYQEYARPDRLEQFELSWGEADLNKMLSRRLEAFSQGRVEDLSQLTDAELANSLHFLVVLFAAGSPRDMIRICQEILAEQLQINPDSTNIEIDAILQGISKFCTRRALEILSPQIYKELVKVSRLDFTATYIANEVFKFDVNSGRNKIRNWTEAGAVEKVGELDSGGHPIYHYAVRDVRVAKAIASQLDLREFMKHKLRRCTRCKAVMIRDWDIGLAPTQTCHSCGMEWETKVLQASQE